MAKHTQPLAKLKIGLTGSKSYYLYNGTEVYYRQMRTAFKDIKSGNAAEYLHFAFFTLCAATLEYSLNFILADFCIEKFGMDRYRTYLEEYINLKFKSKLMMLPNIISDGTFVINEDTEAVKVLYELINLRNRVLHNKEFLTEFELPLNLSLENDQLVIPPGREIVEFEMTFKETPLELLTKAQCLKFGDAIGEFKKLIMTPAITDGLAENKMIKKLN
jgi:hypothetical protein